MKVENTAQTAEEKQTTLYDADANQRFPFEVIQDGEKFDTAHNLKPLGDERYLAYVRSIDLKDNEAAVLEAVKTANEKLWNDLIIEVENFDVPEGQTLQEAIERDEKNEVINNFLAVALVGPNKVANGRRTPSRKDRQTITTEMFFNGIPVKQTHTLQANSDEWKRKFNRIQSNRFKREATGGLSRKPKIEYIPQDEKIGELYDEMLIESSGFENGVTPLRVKTAVIYDTFAPRISEPKVDEKK